MTRGGLFGLVVVVVGQKSAPGAEPLMRHSLVSQADGSRTISAAPLCTDPLER
ncbi:MAG TPA: hypothetical protein VMT45_06405 [Thermoanaerobaculaceae bacterium]|nr:hypothetical protein [Thermoanaerobaculaceae bacterium]